MKREEKHPEPPKPKELPRLIVERDFQTNDWIVWNTVEHQEEFRGTREDAYKFERLTEEI